MEGQRDGSKSVQAYVKAIDESVDSRIVSAINNAKEKVNAMPAPFVNNYTDPRNGEAVEACAELEEAVSAAIDAINKY